MKLFFFSLSFFVLPSVLLAQDILITFMEEGKRTPLADVRVTKEDEATPRFWQSDASGEVRIPREEGVFWAELLGFMPQSFRLTPKNEPQVIFLRPFSLDLEGLSIRAFARNRPIFEQAAPIQFLTSKDIQRFQESSLVPVLNTLPGVRMEERSPASYRISIRGSSLRAPFGVRNVKVYWQGIPLTEPGGSTPLNLLETDNVNQIEIIKGPAGSMYGAGTGGAILFSALGDKKEGWQADAGTTIGSFGWLKQHVRVGQGTEKAQWEVLATRQKGDGYREHSSFDRETVQLNGKFEISDRSKLNVFTLLSNLNYDTPGGLTQAQFEENPRLARPGSADQGAGILHQYALTGLSLESELNDNWDLLISGYINADYFENPFILDYKRDQQGGIGSRAELSWQPFAGMKIDFGGEYQSSLALARNFGNRGGIADTLRFDDELRSKQHILFSQIEYRLEGDWFITAGLSYNSLDVDVYRLWDAALRESNRLERNFGGLVMPRLALLKSIQQQHALHASWSKGFSPPTIQEIRTNEGSLNRDLEPEIGTNWELGYRYRSTDSRINTELNVFRFVLDQTIATRTDENGVVLFRNAGNTLQQGLELAFNWQVLSPLSHAIGIQYALAYTYHDFIFEDYVRNVTDFSGNRIPGISPHIVVNKLDLQHQGGYYLNLTHTFSDEVPLTDANSAFAPSFHLVQARIGRKFVTPYGHWELFGGVDNLLDEAYSLGNDLNAFGGRFFQPAPGRNWFAGLRVGLGK